MAVGNGVPAAKPDEAGTTFGQVAEADLAQHARGLRRTPRAPPASAVKYLPQTGDPRLALLARGTWRQAIAWGLFRPVDEHPSSWTYRTVSRSGDMWGLRFRFASQPDTVESFRLSGGTLSASGAGSVTIDTPDGCRLRAGLPFSRHIPSGCTLHIRVRPRRVRAGRVVRLRVRAWVVRDGRRVPVRRVRVRVRGKRVRTGRHGLATMKLRFHRRGRYRVRAARRGLHGASAFIRVR